MSPASFEARDETSTLAPRNVANAWFLHVGSIASLMLMLGGLGCSSDCPPPGATQDAGQSVGEDSGVLPDIDGGDARADGGARDGGDEHDSGETDAGSGGAGAQDCVTACQTFSMTNCNTDAANFCANAVINCEGRYDGNPECRVELAAMDACAAVQAEANFVCPLGTIQNQIRPYNTTEDVCVIEANALINCLNG